MVAASFTSRDTGKARIKRSLKAMAAYAALVGIPSNAQQPTDHNGKPMPFSMASLALVHEKGSPSNNIPARPFMNATRKRVESRFSRRLGAAYKRVVAGKDPVRELQRLGVEYEGEMKNTFMVEAFAPNKPKTIKRKGSSRPLIDTGHMRQSITSKVVKV